LSELIGMRIELPRLTIGGTFTTAICYQQHLLGHFQQIQAARAGGCGYFGRPVAQLDARGF